MSTVSTKEDTTLLYRIVLFAHIIGALSLFVGVAGIVVGMYGMRKAKTIKQFREWSWLASTTDKAMPFIALLVVVPGVYMVFTVWGWHTAWADVALGTFILLIVSGIVFIGPRLAMFKKAVQGAEQDALVSPELRAHILNPFLWTIVSIFVTVVVSIVFLMAVKPDLVGSLATVSIAIIVGFICALPIGRVKQPLQAHLPASLDLDTKAVGQ